MINSDKNILAIDFGGMSVKYFLIKDEKEIDNAITDSKIVMDFDKLVDDIALKFNDFQNKYGSIFGIAMSFNSPVVEESKVRWGYIDGFWKYNDIKKALSDKKVISKDLIHIINDGKSAAYAELKIGAAQGKDEMVMLTYGTAIGGAAIINGTVVNGKFGLGAGLSNPILGYDGENLDSISIWCQHASMTTLQNNYQKFSGVFKNGKEIFDLFDEGKDEHALKAVDMLYNGIAIQVFNCCYTYGPDIILIGGGLSNRQTVAKEIMTKVEVIKNKFKLEFPCELAVAKLGNKAGAFGAYYYFLDQIAKGV